MWRAVSLSCLLVSSAGAQERELPSFARGEDGRVTLAWWGTEADVNPREVDRALALFEDDAFNRALVCPGSRGSAAGADLLGCVFPWSSTLDVGGVELVAAVVRHGHEFDGMYGIDEEVVIVDPRGDPVIVNTLAQWTEDVVDCRSTLVQRRFVARDLDADGEKELCVESVEELGSGLFVVMDVQRWFPTRRTRGIDAFSYDAGAMRFVRRPTLDGACPQSGYAPFVTTPRFDDPLYWRRSIQGAARSSLRRSAIWRENDPSCGG
jgi:hypothetical protein